MVSYPGIVQDPHGYPDLGSHGALWQSPNFKLSTVKD